jgi:transcriptional regulator with XRE-family HTH domain
MAVSFGELLRTYRRSACLTQEQLALLASISSQAIGALERGTRRFPHQHTITRLAEALALSGEQRSAFAAAAARQQARIGNGQLGGPRPSPDTEDARTVIAGSAGGVVPRQLPPPPSALTGRDALIAEVGDELRRADPARSRTAVLVGPGGVGKTAVALAVGQGLLPDLTDGQLFADLRGMRREPVDPYAVLTRFLRALGMASAEVPEDRDERLAAYRSILAGRRVLLVLDDAATEEQIRPLLPPAGGSVTIVTSRRRLGALVGAARWTVPALSGVDGLRLLARIAGPERVAAEPDAAGDVVEACGYSPLAICIAAGRLAVRRDRTIAELHRRLTAEPGRLDTLSIGDLDVRASIGLSYQALGPSHRLLFRRLGLLSAPEWPAWVADELLGGSADLLLDELVNLHLVEPVGVDKIGQQRFRLQDLVADFARERAATEAVDGDPAVARLLTAWLALGDMADDWSGHGYGSGLPVGPAPQRAVVTVRAAPADWSRSSGAAWSRRSVTRTG